MLIRVLGSAAGGGFPQWNCNCRNCAGLRIGTLRAEPRTQSCIAVSVDGKTWVLCNASPDLRPQIEQHLAPAPDAGVRSSAIGAIILIDAQIEHALGLLLLREHDRPLQVSGRPGATIALIFEDQRSGRRLLYAPVLGSISPAVQGALASSHCVLVDGTFWSDEEMIHLGVSRQRAADLGHLAQAGPDGMIVKLQVTPDDARRILIHINNTNPILDEFGPERRLLTGAGIEVAYDGMEIAL